MPLQFSNNYVRGYTILVLSAIIWGTEAIAVKLCYGGGFTVFALLAWRYAVSVPVFALLVKRQGDPLLPPRELLKPLLLLSLNVVAGVITLYVALALLPATLAILFFYAYPSFTSLLHMLLRRGSLGAPRVLALLISAAGLILLYWSTAEQLSLPGVLCALLSAALQAVKLFQTAALLPSLSAARVNFFNGAFTAICSTLIYCVFALGGQGFGLHNISAEGWIFMLVLGMVITVWGNQLMLLGIHYVGAVDTSLVLLLEPLTTAVLAFIIFGDKLGSGQMLGGLLILLAVALPAAAGLRRQQQPKKENASNGTN